MIKYNHMATAAKANKEQLDLVGQVTEDQYTEMCRLEARRIRLRAFGKRTKIFRLCQASRSLTKWMYENNMVNIDWGVFLDRVERRIEIRRREKMVEKVCEYRRKYLAEDAEKERKMQVLRQNWSRFWNPIHLRCDVCEGKGHRTKNCDYTYDKIVERMEKEKTRLKDAEKMSQHGGTCTYQTNNSEKKIKMTVVDIETFFEKYTDLFYKDGEVIKYCKIEKCKIKTKKGAKVVKKGQMIPQALLRKTEEYIQKLEERNVIRRSNSEWRNPIRSIAKPNGEIRLVSNFMALNDLVEKDPYELKGIRDVINATQGNAYFTVIDLKEGFYSIEIEEEDKKKTAFEFSGRIYEWNSMVMGFKNAPQILQRVMNTVLEKEINNGVSVYMDDVVIYGKNRIEHDETLKRVLEKFRKNNLKINKSKIQFALGEVELLGVKINGKEQTPNEIKKNETLTYPEPKNLKELRRFLGLAGWFRAFIKNYADLTTKMTSSLRKTSYGWRWNEELQNEFDILKSELSKMQGLVLPNYKEEFVLKTDASNVGLGAVLMQKNNGNLVPIQWASKKLTPTESRYGISEKEMLAVYWGIKKFEYELRGRKFHLITDHKVLENIRDNQNFKNNRINRWIDAIQEFDFTIEYQKPESLVGPDALSRIYESNKLEVTTDDKNSKTLKGVKILQGKINKHILLEDGIEYWISDNGLKRIMPKIEERINLAKKYHIEANHRGIETTYYKIKQKYYWIGMKKTLENVIKKCLICAKFNRKQNGGCDFVETKSRLEKVAIDIIDIDGIYILVAIDYFTRYVWAKIITNKSAEMVLKVFESWMMEIKPQCIVTDNGKEFVNGKVRKYFIENNIEHHKIAPESHRSNGRIERVIRTIRSGMLKCERENIEEKLEEVIAAYNASYHTAIGMSPNEGVIDGTEVLEEQNCITGKYALRFKKGFREKFTIGQKVLVAKKENISGCIKKKKGLFIETGIVVNIFNGDSYLVRMLDGKMLKKRHCDLKAFVTW